MKKRSQPHKHARVPKNKWDYWGVVLSVVCIVHCLAVPILILAVPAWRSTYGHNEDYTHSILLAFILGVAGVAFMSGFRFHRSMKPVLWFASGMTLVLFATYFAHQLLGQMSEPVFAILGSMALIRAHILNRRCTICEHDHRIHHHEDSLAD